MNMNLNRIYNRNQQQQKIKNNDSHIINSLQDMFKQINWIIRDTIDTINQVYKKYQLRYSVNQYQDTLLKILTPLQIKGYIDKRQAYLLFENKNDAYNLFNQLKGQYYHSYPNQPRQIQNKKNRNNLNKPTSSIRRFSELPQQKQQYYKSDPEPNINHTNLNINTQLLRNKIRGQFQQKIRYNNTNNQQDVIKYKHGLKERKPGVRSRGLQDSLCTWIKEESKIRPVGRLDVINRAKQLGKNNNLKASVGWYSNFIRRNPQIRIILSKGNAIKRQGQAKQYPEQHVKKIQQQEVSRLVGIYDEQGSEQYGNQNEKIQQSANDFISYSDFQSNSEFNPINPYINPQPNYGHKSVAFGSDQEQRKDMDQGQGMSSRGKQK